MQPQHAQVTASRRITEEVTSWPGVEAGPGQRGEFAFKLGGREIGHLHGDHAAHFFFPKQVWAELREQGRIVPHPVFPDRQGPAARRIENEADVRDVIELLRLNYDRLIARHAVLARTSALFAGRSRDPAPSTGIADSGTPTLESKANPPEVVIMPAQRGTSGG